MIYKITVPIKKKMDGKWDKPPTLNDHIRAERTTIRTKTGKVFTKGSILKKTWQEYFSIYIRKDMGKIKIEKPILCRYHYHYPDSRADYSNIHSIFCKYFEDALQECGTIINDNQKYIKGFTADFDIDKEKPRIEVELEILEVE